MKIINFIKPSANTDAWDLLMHSICSNFRYPQAKQLLADIGYYIPEDQYNYIKSVVLIQCSLAIGVRQHEVNNTARGGVIKSSVDWAMKQ